MTDDAQQPENDATGENSPQGFDDMSEYLQVYLDESDEELDALIDALLKLEDDATDRMAIDESFRLLHTLKGSAGMMGFEGISNLAHHMESRFEAFRSGGEQLDRPTMSLLLRCIDSLRQFNGSLRAGESADHDTAELIADFLKLAGSDNADVAGTTTDRIHVIVRFEDGLQLADLKARLLVARLSSIGEIVGTEPPIDDVESFDDLPQFALILLTDRDRDEIAAIANIDGVAEVEVHVGESADNSAADIDPADPLNEDLPLEPLHEPGLVAEEPPASAAVDPPMSEVDANTPGGSSVTATVRVDIERLDDLMNLTGELVVTKARFAQLTAELGPMFKRNRTALREVDFVERLRVGFQQMRTYTEERGVASGQWTGLLDELDTELDDLEVHTRVWEDGRRRFLQIAEAVDPLNRISDNLQQSVLDTRMVPIGPLFNRFRRVIRDLACNRDKKVRLVIRGETTELDKRMIDELGDPLVHMVRNAIDHGLESSEDRKTAGKPETGTVELEATHSGNSVLIRIRDDGAGIPVERVRRRIVDRNLLDAETARQLSDQQVTEYIWHPGLSTAESVTDVSGRGVGMDVVKNRIADLNGTIDIDSQPGLGTTFTLRLPLVLAIIRSLLVRVCGEFFSIPVDDVREIVEVPADKVLSMHGMRTIDVRGQFVPVITLEEAFAWRQPHDRSTVDDGEDAERPSVPIVIVQLGETMLGICVDELHGGADIVIKSLADNFTNIRGLSGASVMADGAVCLMLDANAIITLATRQPRASEQKESNV